MDPSVSASFIPKKPLVESGRGRGSAMGIILLLSILIFVASLLAAGAAFAYTQFLHSSIAYKQDSLTKAQQAYDPGAIEDLIRLDSRIVQSKSVLSAHVAPSAVFAFLSTQTLENVQFSSFNLGGGKDGDIQMELSGQADSFSTIALQSDQFGASKVLKDVIFSELVISSETGKVTFSVSTSVDPELLLYSKSLTAENVPFVETTDTSEVPVGEDIQEEQTIPAQSTTTPTP